jgi:hypothetical protein
MSDYDAFVAASPQGTVFARSWWLDATAGPGNWKHAEVRDAAGKIVAAWPVTVRTTRLGAVLGGPRLTPYLGPLLSESDGPPHGSREIELLEGLVEALRPYAHLDARCSPRFDYWTPLAWHGFTQTTHYTWRLEDVSDEEATHARFRKSTRSTISRAKRDGLAVEPGTVDDLLALQKRTFERHDRSGPPEALVRRIAAAAAAHDAGEIRVARDPEGRPHSAALFVWDERSTWYLAAGNDTELRASGGAAFLLWEAIRDAGRRGTAFDFEGSMLRPIESFVRGFGGTPTPYSIVRHTPSRAWRTRISAARLVRRP